MTGVVVDFKGLTRKVHRVRRELDKADQRAQRDAAKQTRTAASKMIRERLNLPKKQSDRDLKAAPIGGGRWEFRAGYRRTPAHRFRGYRPNNPGGRGVSRYLRAKFRKGRPAITYRRGFTLLSGGTRVAMTRVGRARKPFVPITGPSAHGELVRRTGDLRRIGRAAYARRSEYHKGRALDRLR